MKTSTCQSVVGLSVTLLACLVSPALAQKDPETTVGKSLLVLSEITRNPQTAMPRLVMRNAEGFAIIPDMFKMSFIFGARFGRGLLVMKQPDGTWSNPVFIQLVGGSFGAQAGAQSTDLVLVFQTRKGLDRFLKGKDKLTLGVDVGAAAGPVGKRFEASTDPRLRAEILSYSNTRGFFAGVSADGGTLLIDWKSNIQYYHQSVSPGAILAVNSTLPVPPSTISLQQLLAEKTAWPERVVKSKKLRKRQVIIGEEMPFVDDVDGARVDGANRGEPVPGASSRRPRTSPRPAARPRAEPGDDDLDAIPPPTSRKKTPGQTRPQRPNDEDLPEALPAPAPAGSKPKPKPKPKPAPASPDDTEVPRLDPPG
ncbi:MAG: lipid-binding SYLF domain-containing protein [Isosphaeraceae bacterium]